jgi:hypothetical protein
MRTGSAAEAPLREAEPVRRSHEVRVKLPGPLMAAVDDLIGQRHLTRAEVVRALLYSALKEQL